MSENVHQERQADSGLQTPKNQKKSNYHKREGWLSHNIAPMLALVAVIGTFLMFTYFIYTATNLVPGNESEVVSNLEKEIKDTELTKSHDKEKVQKLNEDLAKAKSNQEVSRGQRIMVKDFILYILGVLSSLITTIYGYYFGSSRGSASKDDTMKQMAKSTQEADASCP
jgi:uncharacterized protein YycO